MAGQRPRTFPPLTPRRWPKQLADGIHALGARTRLHICGNTRRLVAGMGRLGCNIVEVDSLTPISLAREQMPRQIILGNLNPVSTMRNGTPEAITEAVQQCHRDAGGRFIVGAGCEIPRDTPPANFRALCDYARLSRP